MTRSFRDMLNNALDVYAQIEDDIKKAIDIAMTIKAQLLRGSISTQFAAKKIDEIIKKLEE